MIIALLVELRVAPPVVRCAIDTVERRQRISGMDMIDLVITVCAVLSPNMCEEKHLVFQANFSLQQCAMAAPPYIAQWIGEHPKWTAVKWRCEYPHTREKV
jgi:hypothetical protein